MVEEKKELLLGEGMQIGREDLRVKESRRAFF